MQPPSTHTHTHTKAPGEVISLGLQLSEQHASVGGEFEEVPNKPPPAEEVEVCLCLHCGTNAPIWEACSQLACRVCTGTTSVHGCVFVLLFNWVPKQYFFFQTNQLEIFYALKIINSKCHWI